MTDEKYEELHRQCSELLKDCFRAYVAVHTESNLSLLMQSLDSYVQLVGHQRAVKFIEG